MPNKNKRKRKSTNSDEVPNKKNKDEFTAIHFKFELRDPNTIFKGN